MVQDLKEQHMRAALAEAKKAFDKQEVPVGAVVVCNDIIIARAHNLTETLRDPTAHAEMQAITAAADWLGESISQIAQSMSLSNHALCAPEQLDGVRREDLYMEQATRKKDIQQFPVHYFIPKQQWNPEYWRMNVKNY